MQISILSRYLFFSHFRIVFKLIIVKGFLPGFSFSVGPLFSWLKICREQISFPVSTTVSDSRLLFYKNQLNKSKIQKVGCGAHTHTKQAAGGTNNSFASLENIFKHFLIFPFFILGFTFLSFKVTIFFTMRVYRRYAITRDNVRRSQNRS